MAKVNTTRLPRSKMGGRPRNAGPSVPVTTWVANRLQRPTQVIRISVGSGGTCSAAVVRCDTLLRWRNQADQMQRNLPQQFGSNGQYVVRWFWRQSHPSTQDTSIPVRRRIEASCAQPPPDTSFGSPPGMVAQTPPMLPFRTHSKTSVDRGYDQWPIHRSNRTLHVNHNA